MLRFVRKRAQKQTRIHSCLGKPPASFRGEGKAAAQQEVTVTKPSVPGVVLAAVFLWSEPQTLDLHLLSGLGPMSPHGLFLFGWGQGLLSLCPRLSVMLGLY